MSSPLKARIDDAIKSAMRNKEKTTLETLRMAKSAIKQVEIDQRIELTDTDVLTILNKLIKQRQESIKQFNDAGRDELAAKEQLELEILSEFLPPQLDDETIATGITEAIKESGAESVRDMGKVMAILKAKWTGQADMGKVSQQVKSALA